ncbi:MAG: helix-turn-helix domain-containing protein [Bacteroidales bacterium]|jgi:hypothetical protein|nr:helix-turn-helix domain-containing protein [Bacteroidales bacterium]
MTRFEFIDKLISFDNLLRRQRTGKPKELARRLSISRTTLYEIIDELKARGIRIKYCRFRETYSYDDDTSLEIRFGVKVVTDPEEMKNISGGTKFFRQSEFFGRSFCNFADRNILQCAMWNVFEKTNQLIN